MRSGLFSILMVCLGVVVSGCVEYDSEFLGKECVSDADCTEGYHCDLDVERCRKDCVPDCSGKCCGSDGCGGVCPDKCPDGESCDRYSCRCEGALECERNDDCPEGYWCDRTNWTCRPIDCIPDCSGKCCGSDGCGGTCANNCPAGYYCDMTTCRCRAQGCTNDADCMPTQCCIQGICTNMSCGVMECGPDPVCGKSCGTCGAGSHCDNGVCVQDVTCVVDSDCPAGQICLNGMCVVDGDGSLGDPCTFGDVNASAGDCNPGLECLGVPADGNAGTCPGGSPSECNQLIEEWNIDCVNGNCGVSFCSQPCDANGNCPEGFVGQDIGYPATCFCIPTPGGDGLPGDPCPWGDVNAEYDHCADGLVCLGSDDYQTCPGGAPAECITDEISYSFNPDCNNGICGFSFCSEECDANGNCPTGFVPADVSGTCYCIPA